MATQSYFGPAGLALKIAKAFEGVGMTPEEMNALAEDKKGLADVLCLRRGTHKVVRANAIVTMPQPPPEPVLDFIIRVDRSVKPNYPDWVEVRLVHPELELAGPHEYNLQTEVEVLHLDESKRRSASGGKIYKHISDKGIIASCLNLQDGVAIQQKGDVKFRSLYANRVMPLWASVIENHDGDWFVPCLVPRLELCVWKVRLLWCKVNSVFNSVVFVHKSPQS